MGIGQLISDTAASMLAAAPHSVYKLFIKGCSLKAKQMYLNEIYNVMVAELFTF